MLTSIGFHYQKLDNEHWQSLDLLQLPWEHNMMHYSKPNNDEFVCAIEIGSKGIWNISYFDS
jgi:hypothetical protein